jgi:hypothetical protein
VKETPDQSLNMQKPKSTSTVQLYDANKYIKSDLIWSAATGGTLIILVVIVYLFMH